MVNRFGYDDSELDDWEKLGLSQEQYWRLKNHIPRSRFEMMMLYLSMLLGDDEEENEDEDDNEMDQD